MDSKSIPGVNPYYGIATGYSKSFQQLIKDIGDAKSKYEEDRVIRQEVTYLKQNIADPKATLRVKRENLVRLIYCEMLGHDASFGYIEAVKFAQQPSLLEKRVAYLAQCILLKETDELTLLTMSSIRRDLDSNNVLEICFGLVAAANFVSRELLPGIFDVALNLMKHKREIVRKKAVMTMLKFYDLDPVLLEEHMGVFHITLCDKDPAVMAATLNVYLRLTEVDSARYKSLTTTFVSILKQINEQTLPDDLKYHGVMAPWVQINLMKILARLGRDDASESEKMYVVLRQCLETVSMDHAIGCAVVYECMVTVATIYPNRALIETCANRAGLFLSSNNNNFKYLGISVLALLVNIDVSFAMRHQVMVIDCLTDRDDSVKRQTLDLLYRMTSAKNVKVVCEKLVNQLRSTLDDYLKADLVTRITTLAERFSPDNEWFISTMNEVFELGGDLVNKDVAHNMMRIIGEGIDDEDGEEATTDLRLNAVLAYLETLKKSPLPDVLVQLACWVVGEYFYVVDELNPVDVLDTLSSLLRRKFHDKATHAWVMASILKVAARMDPAPVSYVEGLSVLVGDMSCEARQRYSEACFLLRHCQDLERLLPRDSSCEDLDVDSSLSFLDGYVANSLAAGARPYRPELKKTFETSASQIDSEESSSRLKFAYPQLPSHASPSTLSISAVPVNPTAVASPSVLASPAQPVNPTPVLLGKENPGVTSPMSPVAVSDASRKASIPPATKAIKQVWTASGYVGSQARSDVTTPSKSDSPRTGSVATESDATRSSDDGSTKSGSASIGKPAEPQPSKTRVSEEKIRLAEELFSGLAVSEDAGQQSRPASYRHSKEKFASRKKPLDSQRRSGKPVANAVDSLLILDIAGDADQLQGDRVVTSDETSSVRLAGRGQSVDEPATGAYMGSATQAVLIAGPSIKQGGLFSGLDMSAPSTGLQGGADGVINQSAVCLFPTNDFPPTPPQAAVANEAISSPVLSQADADSRLVPSPSTAQGGVVSAPPVSESLLIPVELSAYEHSSPVDVCSDNMLRLVAVDVFKRDVFVMVLVIKNQSMAAVSDLDVTIEPPSNLLVEQTDLSFKMDELAGMSSWRLQIAFRYKSPALHMVLAGHVLYRDALRTQKRLFISHVISMAALLRQLEINTPAFGQKWTQRSLYEKKEKIVSRADSALAVNDWSRKLKGCHLHVVEVIGTELVACSTVLGSEEVLVHCKVTLVGIDVTVKSGSKLLNDSVMRMLSLLIPR